MKPHPTFFSLQQMIVDLALIDRNHHLIGSERNENDVEHSFAVAMLCWFICSRYHLPLDLSKTLRYALTHDFVERYAGDVNTFATTGERQQKVKRERIALERLSQEFSDFEDLVQCMRDYEARADDESLFVWTVDKMQALVLADMDGWRPHKKLEINYEQFVKKYSGQRPQWSPHCKEIFESLFEYCKTTYYDRPTE